MKQNLGIMSPASALCVLEGCDPDFFLYTATAVPSGQDLNAQFPGGNQNGGAALWFFQQGLSSTLQSDEDFLSTSAITSGPRAGRIEVETMQVTHIGLQIMSATGVTEVDSSDIKRIAESGLFEFWKDVKGSLESPNFKRDADIEVPVINMPSNVGIFGNTQNSGQGMASLGVPGLLFARQLEQPINLVQGELIAARISFPVQSVAFVGAVSSGAVAFPAPVLTTGGIGSGVGVRLYLFGTAKYARS